MHKPLLHQRQVGGIARGIDQETLVNHAQHRRREVHIVIPDHFRASLGDRERNARESIVAFIGAEQIIAFDRSAELCRGGILEGVGQYPRHIACRAMARVNINPVARILLDELLGAGAQHGVVLRQVLGIDRVQRFFLGVRIG